MPSHAYMQSAKTVTAERQNLLPTAYLPEGWRRGPSSFNRLLLQLTNCDKYLKEWRMVTMKVRFSIRNAERNDELWCSYMPVAEIAIPLRHSSQPWPGKRARLRFHGGGLQTSVPVVGREHRIRVSAPAPQNVDTVSALQNAASAASYIYLIL